MKFLFCLKLRLRCGLLLACLCQISLGLISLAESQPVYASDRAPENIQTSQNVPNDQRTHRLILRIPGHTIRVSVTTGTLGLATIAVLTVLLAVAILLAVVTRWKTRQLRIANRQLETEVSERKRSEEELRKATEMVRAVGETAPLAISAIDLKGNVTFWNPAAEQMFGWSRDEVMGRPVLVIPPSHQQEYKHRLELYERKQNLKSVEVTYLRKDGVLIDASLWTAPLTDERGNTVGTLGITVDITERKRAIELLRISELNFRQLADSMPQIVWTAGPDGSIEYLNRRWYEFTGYSPADPLTESVHAIIHPDDLKEFVSGWQSAVESRESYMVECRFADRKTGGYLWYLCRAMPAPDTSTGDIRWFGTFTDIHDQKRIESAFRRASEDLSQFAYSTSHDLQEPLRRVLVYSQLLEKRHASSLDAEAEDFVKFISRDTRRMCSLIANLAVYTGAGASIERAPVPSDGGPALEKALLNLAAAVTENHATVVSKGLPTVRLPERDLQEVLENLIQNAIQYRKPDEPPRIEISARRNDMEWIISVADNGIGIDSRYTDQIFGVFKRLHGPGRYGSTGMGLAICRKIVEHHGGRIWVESQIGVGSVFHFSVPAVMGFDPVLDQAPSEPTSFAEAQPSMAEER